MTPERLNAAATIMAGMLADPNREGTISGYANDAWMFLEALESAAPAPSKTPERVEPTDTEWQQAWEYKKYGLHDWMMVKHCSRMAYGFAAERQAKETP